MSLSQSGPVVETLAYDLVLEATMRSQHFHSRNLRICGPWKWLLNEFADYYGVSDAYTKLRYIKVKDMFECTLKSKKFDETLKIILLVD